MIFCEIKFLICIQEIPFVRFACTVPKVSSLEIFSHKNIISHKGNNLTNYKGLYAQSLNQGLNRSLCIVHQFGCFARDLQILE